MVWLVEGHKGEKERIGANHLCAQTMCVTVVTLFWRVCMLKGRRKKYPSHMGNKIAVSIMVNLALHKDRSVGMGTSQLEDSQHSDQSIVGGKALPNSTL